MNKKVLLTSLTLGIAYISLTSKVAGPAGTLSANLTKTTCAGSGCHSAASAEITSGLIITPEGSSVPVSDGKYFPGKVYNVTLSGFNTSAATLSKFGFQIAATKDDGTQCGTFSAAPTNTAIRAVSGISILEHTSALNQGTLPGSYTVSFKWTAPAAGAGKVTFNYIIMGVNGNNATSGDLPSPSRSTSYNEIPASVKETNIKIAQSIYPNPCQSTLYFETSGNATVEATVLDLMGRTVVASTTENKIDVSSLASGVYLLRLSNEEGQQIATFVKQ